MLISQFGRKLEQKGYLIKDKKLMRQNFNRSAKLAIMRETCSFATNFEKM